MGKKTKNHEQTKDRGERKQTPCVIKLCKREKKILILIRCQIKWKGHKRC